MTLTTPRRAAAALLMLITLLLPATASAEMRWGATAGPMLTDLHFRQDIVKVTQAPGFRLGVTGEAMFPGIGFGVDIGAAYEMRGANVHLGDKTLWSSEGYGNSRFFLHTLSIPVHLRFKYTRLNGVEEIIAPFVYVGPEFGLTLAHSKCDAFSFPFGEVGLQFGLGAEIHKRWQVNASYTLGMTYTTKARILTNYSARSRAWALSLSYFF